MQPGFQPQLVYLRGLFLLQWDQCSELCVAKCVWDMGW